LVEPPGKSLRDAIVVAGGGGPAGVLLDTLVGLTAAGYNRACTSICGGSSGYVVMPDHLHFFCSRELDAKTLAIFVGFWREWTSKTIKRLLHLTSTVWQEEFFDHVLGSSESYSEKWNYVRNNPVRHGFASDADDWPWQGEIEDLRL
jgi:hypothetical protein